MKSKGFILFVIISMLMSATSCKEQKKKETEEEYKARISAQIAANEAQQRKEDSLSVNIFDDIKFGMTLDEIRQSGVFGELKGDYNVFDIDYRFVQFDFHTRELNKISLYFDGDSKKLYSIDFKSNEDITANHIDDMENDCHKLVGIFEKGFQTKFNWERESVSIMDFNEGDEFTLLQEDYGDAFVVCKMGEKYAGARYYYEVSVYFTIRDK